MSHCSCPLGSISVTPARRQRHSISSSGDRSSNSSGRKTRSFRLGLAWLLSAVIVSAYTYVAYPALIAILSRRKQGSSHAAGPLDNDDLPRVTVVIPCLDEELVIERKIDDVLKQEYPSTSLDVVVVADGSCDRTVPLAQRRGVRVLWQPERRGKAVAVNRGVAAAEGSVVCITDANCLLSRNSIRALAESFHDDNVAVAAGA